MNQITGAGYRLFSDEARKASERMHASIRNRNFVHELANKKYNYQNASIEYYRRLGRL